MKKCTINSLQIDTSFIKANHFTFGRELEGNSALPYEIIVDVATANSAFSSYFDDFLTREKGDAEEQNLPSPYLELKAVGYPSFHEMAIKEPDLLANLIQNQLASEFLGYLYLDSNQFENKKYILQTLNSVSISSNLITCNGLAFLNPVYK